MNEWNKRRKKGEKKGKSQRPTGVVNEQPQAQLNTLATLNCVYISDYWNGCQTDIRRWFGSDYTSDLVRVSFMSILYTIFVATLINARTLGEFINLVVVPPHFLTFNRFNVCVGNRAKHAMSIRPSACV